MGPQGQLLPALLAATAALCAAGPYPQNGPYEVRLRYLDACEEGRPLVDLDLEAEDAEEGGRPVLSGTFTVRERLEGITGVINCSIRTDAGWRDNALIYRIRDWCQEGVIRRILAATNLTLEEDCAVPPGTYAMSALDLDEPVHAAAGDSAPRGLYRTRLELEAGAAPAACATAEVEFASPD